MPKCVIAKIPIKTWQTASAEEQKHISNLSGALLQPKHETAEQASNGNQLKCSAMQIKVLINLQVRESHWNNSNEMFLCAYRKFCINILDIWNKIRQKKLKTNRILWTSSHFSAEIYFFKSEKFNSDSVY